MTTLASYALFALFLALAFTLGILFPRRAKRLANPNPHRLADESYYWIGLDGETYAFTAEQLLVARSRATRLKTLK